MYYAHHNEGKLTTFMQDIFLFVAHEVILTKDLTLE